jgi:hypothetical protein
MFLLAEENTVLGIGLDLLSLFLPLQDQEGMY